ncbi:MAG: hypothetical protein H6Q89_3532 [Myxococcaceae bacterium]|nr:hypothetical protein [Myxococcaceae bacterium]
MTYLCRRAVLLTLLSSAAFAAPPPTPRRMSVLVVPMDKGAESQQVKLETYMLETLSEYQGLTVKPTEELFGNPPDEDSAASLKRAETGFKESREAFEARNYEDAERKLRATVKEFTKAASALKTCGHLCDAVAMYAAVLQARGDVEEAKIAILDLQALGPTFELDRKKYPQEFISLRATVATSRNAQLRGNVNLKTKPNGARVYLDGEFMGYTPIKLETLPIGKHILRVERPGFKQWGTVVEVSPEETPITQELTATPGYKAYDSVLDKLAGEALKEKGGGTMASLAKTLGIDRSLVGVLKEINDSGGTELVLGLYDLKNGTRLAVKKANFQGDEYGQLKSELGRMVNQLMTAAEGGGEKVSKSADPLDNRSGQEDWNAEDKGGNRTTKDKKKKGGDPLDRMNGTEDW